MLCHMKSHHPDKLLNCDRCSFSTMDKNYLLLHLKHVHNNNEAPKCETIVIKDPMLLCSQCPFVTPNKEYLDLHQATFHPQPHSQPQEPQSSPVNLPLQKCDECAHVTFNGVLLNGHKFFAHVLPRLQQLETLYYLSAFNQNLAQMQAAFQRDINAAPTIPQAQDVPVAPPTQVHPRIFFDLDNGAKIIMELRPDVAPITVKRFLFAASTTRATRALCCAKFTSPMRLGKEQKDMRLKGRRMKILH